MEYFITSYETITKGNSVDLLEKRMQSIKKRKYLVPEFNRLVLGKQCTMVHNIRGKLSPPINIKIQSIMVYGKEFMLFYTNRDTLESDTVKLLKDKKFAITPMIVIYEDYTKLKTSSCLLYKFRDGI